MLHLLGCPAMRTARTILTLALLCATQAQAQQGAPAQTQDQPSLSEKLNKSDGVITPPPSGDADMTQVPPNVGGTMPVIPPSSVTPPETPPDAPKPEAK